MKEIVILMLFALVVFQVSANCPKLSADYDFCSEFYGDDPYSSGGRTANDGYEIRQRRKNGYVIYTFDNSRYGSGRIREYIADGKWKRVRNRKVYEKYERVHCKDGTLIIEVENKVKPGANRMGIALWKHYIKRYTVGRRGDLIMRTVSLAKGGAPKNTICYPIRKR